VGEANCCVSLLTISIGIHRASIVIIVVVVIRMILIKVVQGVVC